MKVKAKNKVTVMKLVKEDTNSCFAIYVEEVTDVMYMSRYCSQKSGLTVMLDPETGKPLTLKRYKEIKTNNRDLQVSLRS